MCEKLKWCLKIIFLPCMMLLGICIYVYGNNYYHIYGNSYILWSTAICIYIVTVIIFKCKLNENLDVTSAPDLIFV